MYLSEINSHAMSAERGRRTIRYRGLAPNGARVWTAEEDQICRQFGHDYSLLRKQLPNRTYWALRFRCQRLGLRPKREMFTAGELSRLRRLSAKGSSREELQQAFPTRSLEQISAARKYHGIAISRRPYAPTGSKIIDQIRDRCFALGYTMGDLDILAKSKRYFKGAGWINGNYNYGAIGRAIIALDGSIEICWREYQ
ncbi:SANT/Myb-like DNA-binding domain-containing protein [Oryzicola mucosus]|uniref:Uncharacterized protein n=1 Tax=Oryzicola mucosus TaxID=2767425 RepID=A0A8J6PUR3_9HYPH|nr:hypothetical protein [Oryzicola mucosus]MBD0416129.1 hypothetical protein [Oryzicola mucosus]